MLRCNESFLRLFVGFVFLLGGCESADVNRSSMGSPTYYKGDDVSYIEADSMYETPYEEEEEEDRERYESVGTNPFVVAAHDPFSTFAADVDTASYDIFRRDINNG